MQDNDANCNRNHRWIEDHNGLLAARVMSQADGGPARSFELLPTEVSSAV